MFYVKAILPDVEHELEMVSFAEVEYVIVIPHTFAEAIRLQEAKHTEEATETAQGSLPWSSSVFIHSYSGPNFSLM